MFFLRPLGPGAANRFRKQTPGSRSRRSAQRLRRRTDWYRRWPQHFPERHSRFSAYSRLLWEICHPEQCSSWQTSWQSSHSSQSPTSRDPPNNRCPPNDTNCRCDSFHPHQSNGLCASTLPIQQPTPNFRASEVTRCPSLPRRPLHWSTLGWRYRHCCDLLRWDWADRFPSRSIMLQLTVLCTQPVPDVLTRIVITQGSSGVCHFTHTSWLSPSG